MRRAAASALLAVLAALAAAPRDASAFTKIEGEYQLMLDMRKFLGHRAYPWDFDSNNDDNGNIAEVRLFTQPRAGVEAFLRVRSDWHTFRNSTERPLFQLEESHLRFLWEQPGRGLEGFLFSRQDRFWVDNYLLKIVDSGDDFRAPLRNGNWGPNAQGIRVNSWGFLGLNTSWILSDYSGQYPFQRAAQATEHGNGADTAGTDDGMVVRIRRESPGKTVRLGATYARVQQVRSEAGRLVPDNPEVLALDGRVTVRNIDYSLEFATSRSAARREDVAFPGALDAGFSFFRRPIGIEFPDRAVLVAEARSFRFGAPTFGYLNLAPIYWRRGPLWVDPAGDNDGSSRGEQKNDEIGWGVNGWYLLPRRAITWTSNYRRYARSAYERREAWELYNELYVEFVNGFTGKTYLRNYELRTRSAFGTTERNSYNTAFGELQVESRLAWFRIQTKFKDIGHPFRKQLFSVETRINLTDKLKTYNRYTFANDPVGLRKGIFSQLQYYPSHNVLLFLEYGPGWIGDSGNPVDDGDLEGGSEQVDLVKLILKGTF